MIEKMTLTRKIWIDLVRGFCMLAILLHHTEIYFVGEAVIDYRLYVDNALCTFFFISGYLFYKNSPFDIKYKFRAIIRTIIIPYFIFMTIIAFPKALAHGEFTSVSTIVISILLGQESWFITALVTVEILFSVLLYCNEYHKWILPTCVITTLAISIILNENEFLLAHNYWNVKDGLLAVSFLYIGYLYHQKEEIINRIKTFYYIIILLLFIISKIAIIKYGIECYLGPVFINNFAVFIIDNLFAIILITKLCKTLPNIKPISWVGSHVIVFYFLCGGVPLIISAVAHKIGFTYNEIYLKVITVYLFVCLFSSILTWIIYKYFPWITGRENRNITK